MLDDLARFGHGHPGHRLRPGAHNGAWSPPIDVHVNPESVIVRADVPGADPEEVSASTDGNMLTIRGNRPASLDGAKDDVCWYTDRADGDFHRIVDLPVYVDREKTSAAYENGVLTITMARKHEAEPKDIEVETEWLHTD